MLLSRRLLRRAVMLLLLLVLIFTYKDVGRFFFPFPYREIIEEKAGRTGVDPRLVAALIYVESKFNHLAVSKKGAAGLMQLLPETGEWVARQRGLDFAHDHLFEPRKNLELGIWYLAHLHQVFEGETILALAAYNAGWPRVKEWLDTGRWQGSHGDLHNIPYPETRQYVTKVLRIYYCYRHLYPPASSTGFAGLPVSVADLPVINLPATNL
ncbi:MAG: lytic transglycosylase domain-containing protein [Clostridia bacterium]|nr:lytic transglycosylase domain-containing protein [Clostridia bacterium]